MKLYIPVPDGWTRTDSPGEIVIEGTAPDTRITRNKRIRITLALLSDGSLDWLGRESVRYELLHWRDKMWRRVGRGGVRQSRTLLKTLATGGVQ